MSAQRLVRGCAVLLAMWCAVPVQAQGADSIRALARAGKYDEAELAARRLTVGPSGVALLTALGEVLEARGRSAAAESVYVRAIAERSADSLTAAVRLAVLHYERGERARAKPEFERFVGIYNANAASLTSRDLAAVALACRYLGYSEPQAFKDALKAYDRAIAADQQNADARTALGELFVEKYNGADAQEAFATALLVRPDDPRALLGAARRLAADGQPGADSLLARALSINPNYPDALVMRARGALDLERFAEAQRDVDRALAVNPAHREGLAVAAALKFAAGDTRGYEALRARALALDPTNGAFFASLATSAGRIRRYDVAADFAREGIRVDPAEWRAHTQLGMNLLRLGRIAEGRASLETAFKGDPYDVWVKNTLDLLDTYTNYDTTVTAHTTLMIEKDESAILSLYVGELADRAYETFSQRYGYTPPPPVRIEVYRSHADFSVRTVGMPGIGALGVSFGSTLAFDSPAAKDAGPFNWGSTVWHELAHTFTLGLSDHRVPRWFSEGLSVWEEHKEKNGWGFHADDGFLEALRQGKLVPPSRMNDGFVRPAYPEQIQYSYLQASMICDYIVEQKGEATLVQMLRDYKAGMTTDAVFQRALGTDMAAFDKTFLAYLTARFKDAKPVDTEALVDSARAVAAIGDRNKSRELLRQAVRQDETSLPAHMMLAEWLRVAGDTAAWAETLERSIYIDPFQLPVHEQLATLYRALGDRAKLIRERKAIVALHPVDMAEAWYQLAVAQHEAGDSAGARQSVLRSLEDAPNFSKAQELLLTLVDGRKP